MNELTKDNARQNVRKRYAEISESEGKSCCISSCSTDKQSAKLGYSHEEISNVPEGSNMGLGCGNPQVIAELKKGEVVIDLGCGGGFDCFLAAPVVGVNGHVIGIDMTPEMISKARKNASNPDYSNVEFRLGEIEHLPVADNSADVIISNCVINLSPDKQQVFNEAYRILRKGGRIAISDVVAFDDIPQKIKNDMEAYSCCISGAQTIQKIKQMLKKAGFCNIEVKLNSSSKQFIKDWFPGSNAENYVASSTIKAIKK